MKIDFPYPGYEQIPPVDVPDANLMGVFSPRAFDDVDEQAVLRDGFANPIGAPRLRDAVKKSDRVLDPDRRRHPQDADGPHPAIRVRRTARGRRAGRERSSSSRPPAPTGP